MGSERVTTAHKSVGSSFGPVDFLKSPESNKCAHSDIVGDTNHQCSKQRLSPEKETCDYAQKACLVCGKNAGGASNHNPNND